MKKPQTAKTGFRYYWLMTLGSITEMFVMGMAFYFFLKVVFG